ncbi:extracellular solute-binding protein [Paenibacillus macerans]|nr:extracellular solute-binding protein [Paenibacillus macerans]
MDLIYLPSNQFQLAINNGLLQTLDNYVARDSFPLENMIPSGKLYGLPPTFYGSALVYNQQLFDQYGVDSPTEQMTWEDIIVLANRFPKGLSLPYPSTADWLIDIGQTENLQAYDEQTKTISLNSLSWAKVLELIKVPLNRGNIAFNDINKKSFNSENYAMAVVNYEDVNGLEQQGSELKWKLVTMPVSPASPQSSHHVSLEAEAMKLVKFIARDSVNSQLLAKNQPNYGLPAVTEYVEQVGDHDLSPLYTLKANPNYVDLYTQVDAEILDTFQDAAQGVLDMLLQNKIK